MSLSSSTYNLNRYRFGFNGQERDQEINPSVTTALYWEYDGRLGRRWNIDPVVKPWESSYATFSNNPILYVDILGDTPDKVCDNCKNVVVISEYSKPKGHDDDPKNNIDDAQELNTKAAGDLNSSVIVIYAKNKADMLAQFKTQLKDFKINNLIIKAHGNYDNPGIFIGDDYISNDNATQFGQDLKPFLSEEASIVLASCHSGSGKDNKGEKFTQNVANSSGADVYSSRTWGTASANIFDNGGIDFWKNYANFKKIPSSIDKETKKKKPNAILNLGKWTLAVPNSEKIKIAKELYFKSNGNFKFNTESE